MQGYKHLTGIGWHRFAVVLPAGLDEVSITLPRINECYEIYANGRLAGVYPKMPPDPTPYGPSGQRQTYRLPREACRNGGQSQRLEIAICVWH